MLSQGAPKARLSFAAVFLLAFVSLALAYSIPLAIIDPYGSFHVGLFPVVTLDDRSQKIRLFETFAQHNSIQGLILGSSRSFLIDPSYLTKVTGVAFFNLAVSSPTIEDHLDLYRWVRQNGNHPKDVILGLDIDALADDSTVGRRALVLPSATSHDELVNVMNSAGQLFGSMRELFTTRAIGDATLAVESKLRDDERGISIEEDGSLAYRKWDLERRASTFDFSTEFRDCAAGYNAVYERMTELSPTRLDDLATLIAEAVADGAMVYIWLPPFQPVESQTLLETTSYGALLAQLRSQLERLESDSVKVLDYSDMDSFAGTPSGWYDCAHMDKTNAELVTSRLTAALPA